ncbi:MAG: 2-succinyl-6-hydroxy-2,4-cyclohexadiene-1-carboxylate synthase [Deltaproteobacteria bacterium]|nr:2-succinyl-6-hydroxy-2,4-cyclohexadiene-1-carboxylate synthase [Deltaproteobacteria bacterium]
MTDRIDPMAALHYEITGNRSAARMVVFVHGFLGSIEDWRPVMERLVPECCCVGVDLPGHGKSTGLNQGAYGFEAAAGCVAEVIKEVGALPVALVGYSMGARIALYLGVRSGHVCNRLVVESAGAGIRDPQERTKRRAQDEAWARKLERGRFEDFLRTWYRQPIFEDLSQDAHRLEQVISQRSANDPRELARAMRGMSVARQPDLWGHLGGVKKPVLCIAGGKDGHYMRIVRQMAALMPNARVCVVPEAGHNVHLEQPDTVAESIRAFVLEE